jgi:hypothetical protein
MSEPVICFGQQPCGFFPKRFLVAKLTAARRLRDRIGGRIVWFFHDSDHDYRETTTPLRDRQTGELKRLNFDHASKIQKKYSPLFAKRIRPDWQERTARVMPCFVAPALQDTFEQARDETAAGFCLEMYRRLGLLDGVEVVRSGDPEVRRRAIAIDDCYVDVPYEGEIVRARRQDGKFILHRGGDQFLEIPGPASFGKEQISPTRDTRLRWMQSVVRCTHYVCGAGEGQYLKRDEAPEITYVDRDVVERPHESWIGEEEQDAVARA